MFCISGTTSQGSDVVISQLWSVCLKYLLKQVNAITHHSYGLSDLYLLGDGSQVTKDIVMATEDQFCIPPFSILRGILHSSQDVKKNIELYNSLFTSYISACA